MWSVHGSVFRRTIIGIKIVGGRHDAGDRWYVPWWTMYKYTKVSNAKKPVDMEVNLIVEVVRPFSVHSDSTGGVSEPELLFQLIILLVGVSVIKQI